MVGVSVRLRTSSAKRGPSIAVLLGAAGDLGHYHKKKNLIHTHVHTQYAQQNKYPYAWHLYFVLGVGGFITAVIKTLSAQVFITAVIKYFTQCMIIVKLFAMFYHRGDKKT